MCNPNCDGVHINVNAPPRQRRRLLPRNYSTFNAPPQSTEQPSTPQADDDLRHDNYGEEGDTTNKDAATLDDVTPARRELRTRALQAQRKQATQMQAAAIRRMGGLPKVGDIVKVPIDKVDRGKMDPPTLCAVVVEVRSPPEIQCAITQWSQ